MDKNASIEFTKKFIENILSFFDLNIEVDVSCEKDILIVDVPSNSISSLLIGRNAENLKSLQFLLSTALRNNQAEISRVNLDIAGYKKQHAEKVSEKAEQWIKEVIENKESKILNLNSADRFVVHNVAMNYQEVTTHSEGDGRDRVLIISPK